MTNKMSLSSQGGREGINPDAASPEEKPRNSSGSASMAAGMLDLRQHVIAIYECLEGLAGQGIIDDAHMLPLRRLRQRGFRRGR